MTVALAPAVAPQAAMPRLELLVPDERAATADARGAGMPGALERAYGGALLVPLRHDRPTIVANFASTLDGIVAFGPGPLSGGGLISGFHEPDRFVMGLLRALADVVVVGAGTVRASTNQRWVAEHIHRPAAAEYARWRTAMALTPAPTTVVVTASGDVPMDHPGLNDAAIPVVIATTPAGAHRLARAPLAAHVSVDVAGRGARLSGSDVLAVTERAGARLVLYEGGPHLLAELVGADVLDELFLTLAPQVVGRGGDGRLGMIEGVGLAPSAGRWQDLVSVRRSADHLFLRYRRSAR